MGGKQSKPSAKKRKLPLGAGECPVIRTRLGDVRGTVSYTKQGTQPVYNYLGVPYAAPPIGDRRFCPPASLQPWTKLRNCTVPGPPCPQALEETKKSFYPVPVPDIQTSEDCLYLNIYTRSVGEARKPVMVWIHGGSFNKGMTQLYDGTAYAMYGDVVIVTVGYRLGVLGFLSMDDPMCPGNCGFLDQVAALKWIQQNIEFFGGDPHNVTLFGESAGAISTQYHLVSPLSAGLFHKAISQSGGVGVRSALSYRSGPSNREKAVLLAKYLGCNSIDSRSVLAYLRQVTPDRLVEAQHKLAVKGIYFALTIDGRFMSHDPLDLYMTGHFQRVPHIIGLNADEGYYFAARQCPQFDDKTVTEDKCLHFIHRFLSLIYPGHEDRVLDIIRKEYFCMEEKDRRRVDLELLRKTCANALGDFFIMAATYQSAELHCTLAPTYLYVNNHKPSYSRVPANVHGATHEEELLLSWGDPWMERPVNRLVAYSQEERQLSLKLIKYWTNFAKTGNPNSTDLVQWPMFNLQDAQYLNIKTDMRVADNYSAHKMRLWNHIVPDMLGEMDQ